MNLHEIVAHTLLAASDGAVLQWMESAFYPSLLGILIIASLGIPIPEDVPLIAAGVILHTSPGVATFPLTMLVALIGIMSGDLVLYSVGKFWGRGVLEHRSVRWMISEAALDRTIAGFHRWGVWMCFFGRFFVGIRAVMCMTAGVTRFPYWKFFLADFCGALLSVPLFIGLGYWFAENLPLLKRYVSGAQGIAVVSVLVIVAVALAIWKFRRAARPARKADATVAKLTPSTQQKLSA